MVSQGILTQPRLCPLYLYSEDGGKEDCKFKTSLHYIRAPVSKPASQPCHPYVLADDLFLMAHGVYLSLVRDAVPAIISAHEKCAQGKATWV